MHAAPFSTLRPNPLLATFNQAKPKQVATIEKIRNEAGEIYAVLSYEPNKNYLLMKWVGYSSEEEVKQASLKMMAWQLSEGLTRKCRVHVHDTKEIEGAWIGVVDWINSEMFPRCYQAGLRYNLSITSPDLFSKMSSVALQQQKSWQVPTLLFESLTQAELWIMQHAKSL
ncbi:hypothetical protein GCM10028774_22870 [Spirosoma jeollabukense]